MVGLISFLNYIRDKQFRNLSFLDVNRVGDFNFDRVLLIGKSD